MALSSTMYHLQVAVSLVQRDVFETLDLRLARHPSESMPYLLTRVIAYCLCYEEGIAFSKGLSTASEPAVWIKDLQGNVRAWIEVGTPSAERLHKASKACERVVIFTHHDPALLEGTVRGKPIHRAQTIEVYAIDPGFLEALGALTDRNSEWSLVFTEGVLYVTAGDESLSTTLGRPSLTGGPAS